MANSAKLKDFHILLTPQILPLHVFLLTFPPDSAGRHTCPVVQGGCMRIDFAAIHLRLAVWGVHRFRSRSDPPGREAPANRVAGRTLMSRKRRLRAPRCLKGRQRAGSSPGRTATDPKRARPRTPGRRVSAGASARDSPAVLPEARWDHERMSEPEDVHGCPKTGPWTPPGPQDHRSSSTPRTPAARQNSRWLPHSRGSAGDASGAPAAPATPAPAVDTRGAAPPRGSRAWAVFCDLDGTLCDFEKKVAEITGCAPAQLPPDVMWRALERHDRGPGGCVGE